MHLRRALSTQPIHGHLLQPVTAKVLMVAGGGGGGTADNNNGGGGGGGAGGVVYNASCFFIGTTNYNGRW